MNLFKNKKAALLLLLTSAGTFVNAASNEGSGLVLSDTMIFTFFVVLALIFMLIIYVMINTLKGILEVADFKNERKGGAATKAVALLVGLGLGQSLMAQDGGAAESLITMSTGMYWIMISLNAFLLGIIITLYYVTRSLIRKVTGVEEEEEASAFSQLTASLTDAVPIERESEILMDHEYDGIHELDNNLPPWWKYGFYVTIIFGFIYILNYHVFGTGDLQTAEYNKSMAQAEIELAAFREAQANLVDEGNLIALTDASRLESGKKVYVNNCQVCHGQYGEGMVGPNLTDQYWKHGGGIKNVFNTIKVGVPDKGMISWEGQLTPGQMHEVASYILTLQGTNPPNAKAPEGDIWEEAAEPVAPAVEADAVEGEETMPEQESGDGDQSNQEEGLKA